MIQKKINDSLEKLSTYIEGENFKGFDPYDTLLSPLPFNFLGTSFEVLVIQLQKRNPLNIRPLLGIKKFQSTKGTGLLLSAYLKLYALTRDKKTFAKIEVLKNWILKNQIKYGSSYSWGFDYPYATKKGRMDKDFPTVIHHSYILRSLFEYNEVFFDLEIDRMLKSSSKFVMENLPIREYNEGVCFGYYPGSMGCCYNASLHAAKCLAYEYYKTNKKELLTLIESAVDFVVEMQKKNGMWYYSFDSYNDVLKDIEDKQVDFHQGFILESIFEIKKIIGFTKNSWENAIKKGLGFYRAQQFFDTGQALWRLPKVYPVDIHNQAQGIITFAKLNSYNSSYLNFANKIAAWSINNMQDERGYFYFRVNKFYKNKISYMRWSQVWMLLALSTLNSTKQDIG